MSKKSTLAKKSKGSKDFEDESEDYDDYEKPRKKTTKRNKSGQKSKQESSKMQLIPWLDTKNKKGAAKSNWREKLELLAKQGQSAYKEVYRRAKVVDIFRDQLSINYFLLFQVLRSSAFEGMLLKATWPGDSPVPQEILAEIVKHSVPSFKYGRSVLILL